MNTSIFICFTCFFFCLALLFSACKSSSELSQSIAVQQNQQPSLSDKYNTFREALRADPMIRLNGDFAYHRNTRKQNSCHQMPFALEGRYFTLREIENQSAILFDQIKEIKVRNRTSGFTVHRGYAWNGIVEIIPISETTSDSR